MPNVTTWLKQLDQLAANPGDIQALALAQLEETLKGSTDVTDPTNPVIFLMEASAVNSASALLGNETYTRRLYGGMAQTLDDLYVQMSDVDYLNRFAIPSEADFYLLFQTDELLASMVPTGINGMSMLIIPRFTQFTVNETSFTLQYPVTIIQMANGGLQITYDNSQLSPVQNLTTNIVPWDAVKLMDMGGQGGATSFIRLKLSAQQFAITSQNVTVNYTAGCVATFDYTDQFYYCRAYSINTTTGAATEIRTTHTDQTFDPTQPTLLLKDLGGKLQVSLPQIYLTNRMVGGEIRVDIYTTKGDLTLALAQYAPNSFGVRWNGVDPGLSAYTSPLSTFTTMTIYSEDTTHGGSNGMSFQDLRSQVMLNNYGPVNIPITPTQLSQALSNLGYQSVINVDDVVNRTVLATRALPAPSNGTTASGASLTIQTLAASTNDLILGSTVMNNGSRITLLPTTLYSLSNGRLSVVPDASLNALKAMDPDSLVRAINAGTYLYSPFHYVLDSTNNIFALRPYYLNEPLFNSVQFVEANETVGMTVGTVDKEIIATPTGYRLRIQCQSSSNWKALPDSQVFCQLAFIPEGETQYAYMNGTLIGSQPISGVAGGQPERIFEFDLTSNFDVDSNDGLSLTSFQMFNDPTRIHPALLTTNFDVFWIAQNVSTPQTQSTQIDLDMGTSILPANVLGISRERYNITLGTALESGLWHRSRTVAGSGLNQVYSADVLQYYTQDVYARDPVTGNIILTANGSNQVVFTIIHHAGDPVLDGNGQQVVLHKAGDLVLDANGQPIPVSPGSLQRQCDLLLVEGLYYFATDADTAAYAATIAPTLVNWITEDLGELAQRRLERTDLFFYPQVTVGNVNVLVKGGQTANLPAAQTFSVLYYLNATAWRDQTLRTPLTNQAIQTLTQALQQKSISLTQVQANLAAAIGNNVVGVDISGFGSSGFTTVTVIDDSSRLSIAKQAIVEADGTIGATDGVAVTFVEHDTTVNA